MASKGSIGIILEIFCEEISSIKKKKEISQNKMNWISLEIKKLWNFISINIRWNYIKSFIRIVWNIFILKHHEKTIFSKLYEKNWKEIVFKNIALKNCIKKN